MYYVRRPSQDARVMRLLAKRLATGNAALANPGSQERLPDPLTAAARAETTAGANDTER